ncbi:MAG: phage tail tip lysozyme [Coprococcus sp.]|nr:phage tail tip lysozyme [Coprococcus sp.]
MKKIGKRLLAGCLMSVLVLAQIRPEIAYAQKEMTDVALQAESAVQETEETDIADIEEDNQIASIDDSEVPGSDDIESTETESTETESMETETETEIEMHTITGVQDLAEEDRRIDIAYADKPSLEELVEVMPKTMNVYLDGGKEVYTVPVTWYCVTGDYEETEGHYYQFSPLFDETQYQLSADLDLLTEVPYISVFLYASDGISLLSSNSESSNTTIVFNYLVDELKMNSAAACGVLANIYYESGFDPHMEGDNNTSYGICQWHADRKTNLINYCKSNNLDYTTLEGQLAFLKYELVNSYSKIYNYMLDEKNTADGAYDAGWYWCYNFEVPANRETVSVTRGNLAKNTYWEQYGKDEIAPPAISNLQNLENGILLQWKVTAGVSGYNIYRKTSLSDAWTQIDSVSDGDINRYTDKNVSCGTNYYYAVTSYVGDNAYDTYVTTESVNYRTGPGTSYAKAGTLESDVQVKVDPSYKKTADGYTWYKIHYSGSDYYVASQYLKKQSSASGSTTLQESEKSSYKSIMYLTQVTLTKSENTADGVKISWNKVKGASEYYVYRKGGDGKYTRLGKSSGNTLNYTDKTAESGSTYTYTVRAVSGNSIGTYKSTSTIYCLAYPVISSVSNVQNGIHISWNKVKGASEYYLYRKGSDGVYSRLASVSESTLSYTDKKAVNGEKYVYTLRAVNKNTISAYHSLKGIVCLSVPVLDKAASKQDGMHISWKSVKGADAYYIYRKTGSGSWQRIGTTNKGTAVSYTDGSAVGGVTYSYTVRACKDSSLSGYDRKGLVQRYSQSLVNYKTIEKVNYRTGAGTSYNIGGTFNKGTAVKVVANYSVKADGYTWYKIYYNGRYYYAANKYLKKA